MISRSFFVQVILRIVFISLTALAASITALHFPIYIACIPGAFLVLLTIELIRFINRNNRKVTLFFDSIKNEDFNLKFPEDVPEKSFRELHQRMNQVNEQIQHIFMENRAREAYFQEVLKQVDVGILCYNLQGHVLFANRMVKRLLNCEQLNHIRQLEPIHTPLYQLLSAEQPFGRKLIELSNEREVTQLSLKSSAFQSTEGPIGLLTVQDIRNELDEKETDSWTKLIRVMTHEIMNAVTPITSISAAILSNFKLGGKLVPVAELNEKRIENTVKGLEVINLQGKDLMNFVHSYRSFLSISEPEKEPVTPQEIFDRIRLIFAQDLQTAHIRFETLVDPGNLELYLDKKQIIQVMVNLCKNAVQSITGAGQENGILQLFAGLNAEGNQYIEVRDNGPGIEPDLIEHIFVPFFTTKKSGSGIGLSLSRQILRLHGGSLKVHSSPFQRTSFFLNFGEH